MNAHTAMAAGRVHSGPAILTVFALTYLGLAMGHVPGLKINRAGIALLGAIAMMILGGVTTDEAVSYLNWPTVLLLFGFFVISAQLRLSGFYEKVANGVSRELDQPAKFLLALMAVTAGLSAFLNHDIVCLVFTPIVGAALARQRINPVPFLIALAIASNIGAAATLIGNPQDIMIGAVARLNFLDYALWSAVPVFFALGGAYGVIWMLSRNRLQASSSAQNQPAPPAYPFNSAHTVKGFVILTVVLLSLFFSTWPKEIVVLSAAAVHLASPKFRTEDLLGLVEWPILVLFMGLFVVTGSFQSTGYGEQAARWLAGGGFSLDRPRNLALAAAVLSNLINNSAAVMLLLKVVNLSQPALGYVLAVANSFGGSLIIVGSVSNIIVVQQARELGVEISFRDFARLGVPATLISLGGLLCWVAWMT